MATNLARKLDTGVCKNHFNDAIIKVTTRNGYFKTEHLIDNNSCIKFAKRLF